MTELPIDIDDVHAAAAQIAGVAVVTPLLENAALNRMLGGRLLIKAEPLQRTGSFKFRGAYNHISRLGAAERRQGVIAYSSGNHAQGVAAAASLCETPATIIMPDDAPAVKREGTLAWGAKVVSYARSAGERREEVAEALLAERPLTLVRPFDDPLIMAGQGTVGLELMRQAEAMNASVDQVLVPCGGGGLTSGVATAVKGLSAGTAVHGVEPQGWDDTARSLAGGQRQEADGSGSNLCDALLSPAPGELTFAVNRALCAAGMVVDDAEVAHAMRMAFLHLKLVAEPGGAVALAAALSGKLETAGRTTVAVISGGNVDPGLFQRILELS